uniref:Uncharacterized protein n=1 Tax=Anopheles maculatus TaxID=74869 RepID=A0A182SLF1_9DIPT
MVQSTLYYLQEADDFMYDVVREVDWFGNALNVSVTSFAREMQRLKQSTMQYASGSFGCSLREQNATLVQLMPVLSGIANFSSTLQQPLETLLTQLAPDYLAFGLNDFATRYTAYISAAVTVKSTQGRFVRDATCALLKKLVLTLISLGPQNEYCFNRYASRVYGMYELHHNVVSECFEAEADRLATLTGFLRDAVDVLLYEVEDVADNLAVCVALVNGRTDCITQFGVKYVAVAQLFASMLANTMKFYAEEFVASGERLGACVTSSQHRTLTSVTRLEQRVETCQQLQ